MKLMAASRKRQCIEHACPEFGVSERRACKGVGQHRSTRWRKPQRLDDEDTLMATVIQLASMYERCGHPPVAFPRKRPKAHDHRPGSNSAGWPHFGRFGFAKSPAGQRVNAKRVERDC